MYPRVGEKRRIDDINLEDEEAIGSLCRLSGRPVSPKSAMEHEKRLRREIANSNERRRMQSINAGFASLKTLLPHHEGEKLSKATILQQTADYIYQLEQEKTRLLSQNCQLKRLLNQQHHSDPEGSPPGGSSPNEDRILNSTPPPPVGIPTTTLSTPILTPIATPPITTLSNKVTTDSGDFRREILDTRVQHGERRTRLKQDDHISRNIDAEVYSEKQELPQVKFNYSTVDLPSGVKIEIKNDTLENHQKCDGASPLLTTSMIELKKEGGRSVSDVDLIEDYPGEVSEIALQKPVFKSEGGVLSSTRVALSTVGSATALCSPNSTGVTYRNSHPQPPSTPPVLAQPTTILTVMPSNKANGKTLSPVLDLRELSSIEGGMTSSTATVEYVEDGSVGSLRNHTLYIVNSSSSSCQKSLDTICEAIRHLEGDHMFPLEEQAVGSDIKEEVVTTEETFTVEEDQVHHAVSQDHHHQHIAPNTIVKGIFDSAKENNSACAPSNCGSPAATASNPISSPPAHSNHPLGGAMGHLTLHMIPPEPQEVPLELTTTHRSTSEPVHPHQYVNHEVVCSTSPHVLSHPTTFLNHTSRPGVIVVKHQ